MGLTTEISRAVLYVEILDGIFIVKMPKDKIHMIVDFIAGISEGGTLNVFPAPDGTKFEEISKS